jgi:anti-anti-sigma factor
MAFRTDKIGNVVVIVPEGMLTGGRETDLIEHELRRHVQSNAAKILLDLRNVEHLSSVAIGMVVGVYTSAKNRGLEFAVCNVERRIQNVLTIIKVINVLVVYDTREDALEAMRK